MSQENVEVVRRQYAAVNEGDFARAMSCYSEDVELVTHAGDFRAGMFKGREAVGRWFGDWFSSFRDSRFDIEEVTDLPGGAVLLVAEYQGRGKTSGVAVRGKVIWVYRLREGKIARVEGYGSRDEALEAVGLRE
jgi:ketosteroid isomerase-like protein